MIIPNTNTQIQVHKYKYTNTSAQIQIHKYKCTNTNTQMNERLREQIAHWMETTLDEATDPWGVKVERVEM